MSNKEHAGLPHIEWEGFTNKLEINTIIESEFIPKGSKTTEIWRDDNYMLNGRLLGECSGNGLSMNEKDGLAGAKVPSFEIRGTGHFGLMEYKLNPCYIKSITNRHTLDPIPKNNFDASLLIYHVEKKQRINEEPISLVEWYLNGPSGSFIYPRQTTRQLKKDFIRKRFADEEKIYPNVDTEEFTRDFAFIELENRSFLIQAVPKYFGPEWSNCIGIEYREEWGGIPEEDEREGIGEIVGFILGKHLLNVGYTKFADTGYPLEEVAVNPWGDNIVSKCQAYAVFPVEINSYVSFGIVEEILTKLIPQYLLLRDDLNLKQALWNYFIGLDLPIGVNLPVLSAGVETIAKSWFKTSKSKTKGVYIGKKEYDKLIETELNKIEEKLSESVYQQKLLNKIKNAYNMSANDRLDFFFQEIALPIGQIEKDAITGRNVMAHGDVMNEQAIENMTQMTRAFQTLFHRIVLKILGYDGDYIDRSKAGLTAVWPKRHIDEPMQGLQPILPK